MTQNAFDIAGSGPRNANPGALAASLVVKDGAGRLLRVTYTNTNAATRYLQVFDSATVPADTAVPLISIPVATGASFVLDFAPFFGRTFRTGIAICHSSTAGTKTVGGADALFDAQYL